MRSIFNELKTSLREAVEIEQGKISNARGRALVTRYEAADVKVIRTSLNVSQVNIAELNSKIVSSS